MSSTEYASSFSVANSHGCVRRTDAIAELLAQYCLVSLSLKADQIKCDAAVKDRIPPTGAMSCK